MTVYTVLLSIHSWLRWLVLALGCVALTRGGRRDPLASAWLGMLDLQVVIGLTLYFWLSPMTAAAFADPKSAMHDSVLRFWFVEHGFAMLVALIAAHVGWVRARRAESDEDAARVRRIAIAVALVAIVAGVPWSALKYGRPLFRV